MRALHLDPEQLSSQLPDVASRIPSQLSHLIDRAAHLSITLADTAAVAGSDPASQGLADAAQDVVTGSKSGGFFGPIAALFENVLKVLDSGLSGLHIPYSYGFAIILLTIIVKVLTFPLTKKQVESTTAMQALQPRVKEVQAKYKDDNERAQLEVARIYREAQVNPLAGCLPTLATIPVFIGLYRALSNVAEEGLLTEGFFWIPSLGGPTTLAAQKAGGGFSWLLPLVDGAPPIGWSQAAAYLSLPVLLVISQFVSQRIMSPPQSQDPSQQSSQAILKFLPFMIGYFSLNVPSGLALYWFVNNILSTSQQVWLKRNFSTATAGATASPIAADTAEEERQARVRQLTGQETGARRSKSQLEQSEQDESSRKGEKFRALKAKEAARKSKKSQAAASSSNGSDAANATEDAGNGSSPEDPQAEDSSRKSSRKKQQQ